MGKYTFIRDVINADGHQQFVVEADSIEHAKEVAKETGGEFDCEEVEVTRLGEADGFELVEDDYITVEEEGANIRQSLADVQREKMEMAELLKLYIEVAARTAEIEPTEFEGYTKAAAILERGEGV
jgi:hypothetical protein